jgi:hypothetical protein
MLPTRLSEGALFDLDTLSDNPFDPCLQVALMVQSGKKCGALREACGQPDCGLFPRNVNGPVPRRVILRLRDNPVVDLFVC